ncbi:hypothetical protein ACXYMT_04255 [Salinimicrobium sp. CAU 1759]
MRYAAALGDPLSPMMEKLVLFVVIATFLTALLFFALTLLKRTKRLREDQKKADYQAALENILFTYLFENNSLEVVLSDPLFTAMKKDVLFQRIAIKAIISLHDNYSGIYSKKLEQFFEASGLVDYSIARLESTRWPYIVEGVRDLSTLNHNASYSRIASRITHPNKLVKMEVLLALIKMRGIGEITKFQKSGLLLNDWVQSNILFTVKKHKIPAPSNLVRLLESPNRTVVLLTVRLINYYQMAEHSEALLKLCSETGDAILKKEIGEVLAKIELVH